MSIGEYPFNRRSLLQRLGGMATLTAVSSLSLRSASARSSSSVLVPGSPEEVGMRSERIEDVFARIQRRVGDECFPGATALIARQGVIVGHRAFGTRIPGADAPMTLDTMFDVLSITKVIATAASAMVLVQDGRLRLSDKVACYIPQFAANGKSDITVLDMLRHASGLPVDNQLLSEPDVEKIWTWMFETPIAYPPGSAVLYSDVAYRILGRMIEVVAGTDLDTFSRARVWEPLGMVDTMFNPPDALEPRIAATGYSARRGGLVCGAVQDEQDFVLGGITGCDGVFTTAMDLAIFCQMFLNWGVYGGKRILTSHSIDAMARNQTPEVAVAEADVSPLSNLLFGPKGLGWELWTPRFSTGGTRLSPASFGKVGGTGTFMWIDPWRQLFGILLTNHGLPDPLDERGWNLMLDSTGVVEFFDGVIGALYDGC